jgi:deoxycytidine triphosphate deaminase
MISPFKPENLKPAGYELSIGDEFVLGGERKELGKDGEIRILPFNVVVIKTAETINLPRYLIARWNVRVKWAYEGLLWVGGPQVDPGWVGHLFCPLYNLSNKVVVLRYGDPIALMDFVTTTPFKQGESVAYTRPPKRVLLEEYRAAELNSGLYELAETKLATYQKQLGQTTERVEGRVNDIRERVDNFVSITFGVIGLLIAAVTLFFGKPPNPTWWAPSALWGPAFAMVFSLFALWYAISPRSSESRSRKTSAFLLILIVVWLGSMVAFSIHVQTKINDMEQLIRQLASQPATNVNPRPQNSASPPAPHP